MENQTENEREATIWGLGFLGVSVFKIACLSLAALLHF